MNSEVPPSPVPQGDVVVPAAKTGGNKKLLIVIGAIALLAVVVGIAAAVVVFVIGGAADEVTITGTSPKPGTGATTTTTTAPVAADPAEAVTNDEVFTFRDIFAPLAGALPSTTSTTTSSTTTTPVDTSEYAADTLYLLAIQVDGDVSKAQMVWNQDELLLAEGDVISGTPWKVLEIRTSDVVMLYGDQQVVLSVGQGISK